MLAILMDEEQEVFILVQVQKIWANPWHDKNLAA